MALVLTADFQNKVEPQERSSFQLEHENYAVSIGSSPDGDEAFISGDYAGEYWGNIPEKVKVIFVMTRPYEFTKTTIQGRTYEVLPAPLPNIGQGSEWIANLEILLKDIDWQKPVDIVAE